MISEPILIVGENPSLVGDPETPLEGSIGQRLAEYAGITFAEYLERTERRNLFSEYQPEWSVPLARERARAMFPMLIGRRTILLGQRVSHAFELHWPPLNWVTIGDQSTAILPHPSGRNHWWNDATNRAQARRFLRATFGVDDETS